MKITGIICEYNPLHNGHLFHIQKTRAGGATHIAAILSGNFVQRGDVALLSKFDRAALALKAGADLVIELPAAYALSSAQSYAGAGISLLRQLGCVRELSFGCECGSLEILQRAAAASDCAAQDSEEMRSLLRQGLSYPAAVCSFAGRHFGEEIAAVLRSPNDLLGVEYLRAIKHQKADIAPFCVPRTGAGHDSADVQGDSASAGYIRSCLEKGDPVKAFVPAFTMEMLDSRRGKTAHFRYLERILLYRLRTVLPGELSCLPDMNDALQNRILAAARSASLEEALFRIKTRNCTMARIRRILLCSLIGIRREDAEGDVPCARVLAFNRRGREILRCIKQKGNIPVSTSPARLRKTGEKARRIMELEERASDIYGLARGDIRSAAEDLGAKITLGGME